jgi:colanic acid biosynthesis glycosyl transferase WcaI
VPSKMYGILAAGKPIVSVAPQETDVANLCKQIGCGVSCDPDRPEEMIAAVRELAGDPNRVRKMGEAARAAAPNFDKNVEALKFMHILEEAVKA